MRLGRVAAVVIALAAACVVAAVIATGDCGVGDGVQGFGDGASDGAATPPTAAPDGAIGPRRRRGATADRLPQGGEIAPIRGTVVDAETHRPIAGASLTMLSVGEPHERLGTATSAADGAFVLPRTIAGDVGVLVRAEGYAPEYFTADGGVECEVELAREAPLEVLVLDEEVGTPIPGAEVQLHAYSIPITGLPLAVVRTDAAGRATLLCGPAPPLYVFASGYAPVTLKPSDRAVTARLTPADEVSGIVVDERGEPRGQGVTLAVASLRLRTSTDESGRFRLYPVPRGGVTLAATAVDLSDDVLIHTTSGTTDLRVVVPRGGRVRGVVRYPDGTPVEEARVAGLLTGADGTFETPMLPAGRRVVKATVAQYEIPETYRTASPVIREFGMAGEEVVDVPPGGVAEGVEIRVAAMPVRYAIVLVVDADGTPVPTKPDQNEDVVPRADGATAVVRIGAPEFTRVAVFDAARTRFFRIDAHVATSATPDAAPTIVRLSRRVRLDVVVVGEPAGTPPTLGQPRVSNGRGESLEPIKQSGRTTSFLVDPDAPVLVTLIRFNACEIFRRLTADEIASRRVEIRDEGKASVGIAVRRPDWSLPNFGAYLAVGDPPSVREHMFQLRDDGRGTLLRVPAGPARLVTRVGSAVLGERPVVVPETGELDLGVVEAPPAEIVRGIVRLPDGRPAGGASVTAVMRLDHRYWDSVGDTTTGSDGTFRMAVPPGVTAQFVASRTGFGPASVERDAGGASLELRLRAECVVRVRIPLRNGSRGDNVVHVNWPDGGGFPYDGTDLPAAPGERVAELRGLPAARLVLYLGHGREERSIEVTPVPGRATEVAFPSEK